MVLALRVLRGQQLFHPRDNRKGSAVLLAQMQGGHIDVGRLRLIDDKGASVAKAERQAEAARRAVEKEELRDALGRVERLAAKLLRQASGLGMRADRVEGRLLGWLRAEAARLLGGGVGNENKKNT